MYGGPPAEGIEPEREHALVPMYGIALAPPAPPAPPPGPELANRGARLLARVVDWLLIAGPPGVLVLVSAELVNGAGAAGLLSTMIGIAMAYLALLLCGQCYLIGRYGQSLGKRLLGIRVVNADGEHAGWVRTLLVREGVYSALPLVPHVGGPLGLLDSLLILRRDQRTGHDVLAGTYVVRVGEPRGRPGDVYLAEVVGEPPKRR